MSNTAISNFEEIGPCSLELFEMFKGLNLNEAIEKAVGYKLLPRIMSFNGKSFSLQKDLCDNRINFSFENDVVVEAIIW